MSESITDDGCETPYAGQNTIEQDEPVTSRRRRGPRAGGAAGADALAVRTRSSGPEQSINRILDATLDATSRHGLRSLSLSNICRVAGVARGTLYRYFQTKEDLLASLGQRTRERFAVGMRERVMPARSGSECLLATLDFLVEYSEVTQLQRLLEVEPQWILDFLQHNLGYFARVMAKAMVVFFDELEASLGMPVDRVICSEIILRLNASYALMPAELSRQDIARAIDLTVRAVIAQRGRYR